MKVLFSLLLSYFLSAYLDTRVVVKLESSYVYIEDVARNVAIIRGDLTLLGQIDTNGKFTVKHTLENGFYSGPILEILNSGTAGSQRVYEYRSGRLVPGTMKHKGDFIPELNGTIVSFSAYKYSTDAPRIWNLPGTFSNWTEVWRKIQNRLLSKSKLRNID